MMRAWMAAFAALLIAAPAAAQGQYPDKPVRFIVGFTAGSATDITARMFAQKFQDAWNVPVTVENVPGAGGSVGGDRVAKAAPDGTTFYWGANGALTINPTLLTNPDLRRGARSCAGRASAGDAEHPCRQQRRAGEELCRIRSRWRRRSPASCPTLRPASARRSTSPARCSRAWPASTSCTCPIAARCSPT